MNNQDTTQAKSQKKGDNYAGTALPIESQTGTGTKVPHAFPTEQEWLKDGFIHHGQKE